MTAIEYMDMMKSTITTAQATPPMCSAMDLISNSIARPPGLSFGVFEWRLRQLEVDRHRHDDRYRHPVQQRGSVDPLFDRFDRRLVQQGDASEHGDVRDLPLRA